MSELSRFPPKNNPQAYENWGLFNTEFDVFHKAFTLIVDFVHDQLLAFIAR